MYLDSIELTNIRSFGKTQRIEFVHPDCHWVSRTGGERTNGALPKPKLPNVTLLLGDNGSGKTTVLRAIAASSFGPAARDLLTDPSFVRFQAKSGSIRTVLRFHGQERATVPGGQLDLDLFKRGERVNVAPLWLACDQTGSLVDSEIPGELPTIDDVWQPVYESKNDAFFVVAYGATRRVEVLDKYDPGARSKRSVKRDQRVMSLFEEAWSLIPLAIWLPQLKSSNPGRYKQVVHLLNDLLKPGRYEFTGEQDDRGDYLFRQGELLVPFQSLSDGYRAFIGWIADLLHHVCFGCPSGQKLVENRGLVLVDEIDLHLHPKWQMRVVETVSRTLPNMQFILTSHSPLVASSLEWMNLVSLKTNAAGESRTKRYQRSIHGLDADQMLLTELFGLKSTRATTRRGQLERLKHQATLGDTAAKRRYIQALASGSEPTLIDLNEADAEASQ